MYTTELKPGRRGGGSAKPVRNTGDSFQNEPIKRDRTMTAEQCAARMLFTYEDFAFVARSVGIEVRERKSALDWFDVSRRMRAAMK